MTTMPSTAVVSSEHQWILLHTTPEIAAQVRSDAQSELTGRGAGVVSALLDAQDPRWFFEDLTATQLETLLSWTVERVKAHLGSSWSEQVVDALSPLAPWNVGSQIGEGIRGLQLPQLPNPLQGLQNQLSEAQQTAGAVLVYSGGALAAVGAATVVYRALRPKRRGRK